MESDAQTAIQRGILMSSSSRLPILTLMRYALSTIVRSSGPSAFCLCSTGLTGSMSFEAMAVFCP